MSISLRLLTTILLSGLVMAPAHSQLIGTKVIDNTGAGDYVSFTLAINDLNSQGVGSGGVTFNAVAGQTFNENPPTITASGSASNQIVFQKSGPGANPLIIPVSAGTLAPPSFGSNGDWIIRIQSGDYITFDGIDLQDNPAFVGNTQKTEYGFLLVKAATDACKNVTIRNCGLTLDRATQHSSAIFVSNLDASGTSVTVTSTGGRSENIALYGNVISNAYNGIQLRGFNHTSAPFALYDQNNSVGVSAGNTISNYGGGSANTPYGVYAIYQNNVRIHNNVISGGNNTTTTLRGIYTSIGNNASVEIVGNDVSLSDSATSSAMIAIENAMGAGGSSNTVIIRRNTIHDCQYPTATSGSFTAISNSVAPANLYIDSNIVRDNILPGTGTFTGIDAFNAQTAFVRDNLVTGNQKTGASGGMFCTRSAISSITYSGNRISRNSIPNASGSTASLIFGYYNFGLPTSESYFNNVIDSLTIGGTSTATGNQIVGITTSTSATSVKNIYGNTIHGFNLVLGSVVGISTGSGSSVHIYRNRIYDMSAGSGAGLVYGIYVLSGASVYVYNNFISDLRTPSSISNPAIAGLNIAGGSSVGAYYNSIYLNASSTGVLFGSAGVYSSTGPTLDMRNNIVVNASTPGASGLSVAFRRIGTNLATYAPVSNNNDFYAGVSGPSNLIYYDGTNADQTLGAFQSRVAPRDLASFSEPVPFQNVSSKPYDLHMNVSTPTKSEGGGTPILSPIAITTDADNETRLTPPDVGADEFAGTPFDTTAPSISFIPPGNTSYFINRTLTATITDAYGIASGGNGPGLYYKKSTDASFAVDAGPSGTPPQYAFTFNYSLLGGGGVVAGDTILYYVAAADVNGNSATSPPGGGGLPPGTVSPPVTQSFVILPLSPVPFAEDFEGGGGLPAGWSGSMAMRSGHGYASPTALVGHMSAGSPTAFAETPIIGQVTAASQLVFQYRIVDSSGYPANPTALAAGDSITVLLSTDDGVNYSELYSITQSNHTPGVNFGRVAIPLPSFAGLNAVVRLNLRHGAGDYYVDVDDLRLFEPPAPPDPAMLTGPADGGTFIPISTNLDWQAPAGGGPVSGYRLHFGTDGGGITAPTSIVNGSHLGNVLSFDPVADLAHSTTYYWQIVPTGEGGDASGSPIWSFTTTPPSYTIDATAGPNGQIVPSGTVLVLQGQDTTFTILPDVGFVTDSLFVDGAYVDSTGTYTFANVTMNHTIHATFKVRQFTIAASAGPNGSISPTGNVFVDYGAAQIFTFTANTGYLVDSVIVDDAVVDSGGSFTFANVTADHSIRVTFTIAQYSLSITAVNGSVTKVPDQPTYDHGTVVQLTAVPAPGYSFVSWSGDASGSANPLDVTMDGNKNITANFAINTYTLSATAVNGSVTKVPDQPTYDHGTVVQLTAVPAPGYAFVNWSGDASGSANPLSVTMDGNKSITANFALNTYTLTIVAVNGSVTKVPDQASYEHGAVVQLTAVPDIGFSFISWSGDAGGSDNPLNVTMDSGKNITANFAINQYALNVSVAGTGTVTKNPDQPLYDHGSSVQLTATPGTGYVFSAWSGDATGSTNPLTVTMDGVKNITATFTVDPVYLTEFRTATMNDWATAVDLKGKANLIKCKPDKVEFQFTLIAPATANGVKVKIGIVSSGTVTRSATQIATWSAVKEFTVGSISAGDTLIIYGWGTKGKAVKVKLEWATTPKVTKVTLATYDLNQPRLPMPNLINVLSELGSWPTIGNAAGASSVIHPKFKDVQKSLSKKGVLHTGTPRCLATFDNTKPIAKQQKALPPDKHNNILYAEVLTLALNLKASATGNFPAGLGALLYNNTGDPASATFNGSTLNAILTRANAFMGCNADAATAADFYSVLNTINGAFRDGTVDTSSWSCAGVKMTGVKALIDVPFIVAPGGFTVPKAEPVAAVEVMPTEFALNQNYPNPFNPVTTISYELPITGYVTLKVYNMLGQEVATLLDNVSMDEGEDEVEFDASNQPSGVYFYRLTVNAVDEDGMVLGQAFAKVGKMMLMK